MMKQMGGMMGLPGSRRKATKSPKNKRKGNKGGGNRPRAGGGLPASGAMPAGMPQLPPGIDPSMLDPNALPGGFKLPKLDFNKLQKRRGEDEK
jgi:signal recognition particle subunit SRP54